MKIRDVFHLSLQVYHQNHPRNESFPPGQSESKTIEKQAEKLCDDDPFIMFDRFAANEERELQPEDITFLRAYFNTRWEAIRQTSETYWCSHRKAGSHLCWMIAKELSEKQCVSLHPLEILMPTLNLMNPITRMHLSEEESDANEKIEKEFEQEKLDYLEAVARDPFISFGNGRPSREEIFAIMRGKLDFKHKLKLPQIVLSDDDQHIIRVLDCLKESEEDGTLRHTNKLIDNQPVLLSEAEQKRVINHTSLGKKYFELVTSYNKTKREGGSVGAAIYNIIMQLRKSGQGGGRDGLYNSPGVDAIQVIRYFHEFLKCFTEDQKKTIFACKKKEIRHHIISNHLEVCWLYLVLGASSSLDYYMGFDGILYLPENEVAALKQRFNELVTEEKKQNPCVELISGDLKEILTDNEELLYNMKPQAELDAKQAKQISLEAERKFLAKDHEILEKSLQDPTKPFMHEHHAYDEVERRLVKQVFSIMIRNAKQLAAQTNFIEKNSHDRFYKEVLSQDTLRKLLGSTQALCEFFQELVSLPTKETVLHRLGGDYLRSLINSDGSNFKKLLEHLTKNQYKILIQDLLGESYVKSMVRNEADFRFLFDDFSLTKKIHLRFLLQIESGYVNQNNQPFSFFRPPSSQATQNTSLIEMPQTMFGLSKKRSYKMTIPEPAGTHKRFKGNRG